MQFVKETKNSFAHMNSVIATLTNWNVLDILQHINLANQL